MKYYLFFIFIIVVAKSFSMNMPKACADGWIAIGPNIYARANVNPLDPELYGTCNVNPGNILNMAALEGSGFEKIIKKEKNSIFINHINFAKALPAKGYYGLRNDNINEKIKDLASFLDVYLIPFLLENEHFVTFAVKKKPNILSFYIHEYYSNNEHLRYITSSECKDNVSNILKSNSSSSTTENRLDTELMSKNTELTVLQNQLKEKDTLILLINEELIY